MERNGRNRLPGGIYLRSPGETRIAIPRTEADAADATPRDGRNTKAIPATAPGFPPQMPGKRSLRGTLLRGGGGGRHRSDDGRGRCSLFLSLWRKHILHVAESLAA